MGVSIDDVHAAARRLRNRIHRTPVVSCQSMDDATGFAVFLKCENLQRAGAFKIRGALNKLLSLTADERRRGVVAFSSGNHAQGVALAAQMTGTTSIICMPSDAPKLKLEATRRYGAEVVFYDRQRDDREAVARALAEKTDRVLVPPYDDYAIMAGQGTAALELFQDVPSLDALLAPVGGGGGGGRALPTPAAAGGRACGRGALRRQRGSRRPRRHPPRLRAASSNARVYRRWKPGTTSSAS